MDLDRSLRYVIPPFVMITSLVWLAIIDPNIHFYLLIKSMPEIGSAIAVIATGGVATAAIGLLISAISVSTLRVIDYLGNSPIKYKKDDTSDRPENYEADISVPYYNKICELLAIKVPGDVKSNAPVVIFLDWYLKERAPSVRDWIERRWNVFFVLLNSSMALILSVPIGIYFVILSGDTLIGIFRFPLTDLLLRFHLIFWFWFLWVFALTVILFSQAMRAKKDVFHTIETLIKAKFENN